MGQVFLIIAACQAKEIFNKEEIEYSFYLLINVAIGKSKTQYAQLLLKQ